jgi:hypothetical protein
MPAAKVLDFWLTNHQDRLAFTFSCGNGREETSYMYDEGVEKIQ